MQATTAQAVGHTDTLFREQQQKLEWPGRTLKETQTRDNRWMKVTLQGGAGEFRISDPSTAR